MSRNVHNRYGCRPCECHIGRHAVTMRGTRAVAIFVAAVIAVELATKFLLIRMLGSPAAAGVQGGS